MPDIPLSTSATPLSVSTFNRQVRESLESTFPLTWICGEISNLTYAASGHVYFSLKDASAQVRCVMWRSKAQLLGWRLENGNKVEVRALVSFYEPRGEFQINVESIRRAGQGDLFERFLRLKERLEAEGLFATEAKRPLPEFPRHLAIVTSPQAAALQDVLSTLRRRAPYLRITLVPTPVQGDGAGEKISNAITLADSIDCDAIILCRGGGSIEDLWAFNDEGLARSIRATKTPVVSGVGHETDFTIADFAADLRAPTPTAAAELLSPERDAMLDRLTMLENKLSRRLQRTLAERQQQIDWLATRLQHPAERIRQRHAETSALCQRLKHAFERQLERSREQLAHAALQLRNTAPRTDRHNEALRHLRYRLNNLTHRQISEQGMKLNTLGRSLSQLDPHAVLARGYAIAIGNDGKIIRNAAELSPGNPMHITFAKGTAEVTVDRVVSPAQAD